MYNPPCCVLLLVCCLKTIEATSIRWVKFAPRFPCAQNSRDRPTMWMDDARAHEVVNLADGHDVGPSVNDAEAQFQEDLKRCMLESKIACISSIMESKRLFICNDEDGKKQLDQVCDDVSLGLSFLVLGDGPTALLPCIIELPTLTNYHTFLVNT